MSTDLYSEASIARLYTHAMESQGWSFPPDGSDDPAAYLPKDDLPTTEYPFAVVLTDNEGTEWMDSQPTLQGALSRAHDAIAQAYPSKYAEYPVVVLDIEAQDFYPIEARITVEAMGAPDDSVYPEPGVVA